jgi:oligoribonuclease NrnB/cAMP/cGMP phosphodiesterase (DHH superfamily)|tara:strand:+ start:7354 stop:7671 length:318 start_codon:yes stop_codon:yes gene_type:complete
MAFVNLLSEVTLANKNQRQKELWDVEGVLKNRLNQKLKFDLRPIKNNNKVGSFKSKADKMVFDIKDQYIILDTEELNQYIKENNVKDVHLQNLISKLEWNIVLPK